ncbi:DUF192 domain-containing protein [Rhizobium wenxiniae]|uniref:DUF192 domain-containing protein n=1 Tax=Rhizobium wenxiniae TaxID=1737357 RepID=UPI001C6E91B5|nr:DUF192 domain-containing protein [Rhizobium wenxiniae]MBW9089950.1 DUF192 domain-containing protein [Rhizobium wenxiniae]
MLSRARSNFGNVVKGALMALFFVFAATTTSAQGPLRVQAQQAVVFPKSELTIRTAGGKVHPFTVELAINDAQREHGLMFRKQMDKDHGMLFDFGAERQVSMWMENTVLALDMVFIRTDGTISHIRENAVPFSRDIIDSRGPVKYVLELNAGRTKALGIKPGDKVIGNPLHNGG